MRDTGVTQKLFSKVQSLAFTLIKTFRIKERLKRGGKAAGGGEELDRWGKKIRRD